MSHFNSRLGRIGKKVTKKLNVVVCDSEETLKRELELHMARPTKYSEKVIFVVTGVPNSQ